MLRYLITAMLFLHADVVLAGETSSACQLLPSSLVSTITGKDLHIARASSGAEAKQICTYSGDHISLSLSLIHAASEDIGQQRFAAELNRFADGSGQPLRGVGAEARYQEFGSGEGGIIVARFGTTVVVLRGSLEQELLVELARAVAARL